MRADLLYGAFFTILKAVPRTLFIALIVMASAIVLGVFLAFLRMKRVKIISPLIGLLVGYTRGTPMIVQLFIVYYSLPYGIAYMANRFFAADIKAFDVPGLVTIYVTYIICQAGYQCEVIRSALASVEHGQMEGCYSVGMTGGQAMMRIIFPQALAIAIPSFFTHYMSTVKLMSRAFTLQVIDIMAAARLYTSLTERYTESYIAAAVIYWLIGLGLTFVFGKWESVSKRMLGSVG